MTNYIPEADLEALCRTIGLFGVGLYVFGFFCLSVGKLDSRQPVYFTLVLVAASCVMISLWADFNLSAALIQGFYIVMATGGILVRWRIWHSDRRSAQHAILTQPAPPPVGLSPDTPVPAKSVRPAPLLLRPEVQMHYAPERRI